MFKRQTIIHFISAIFLSFSFQNANAEDFELTPEENCTNQRLDKPPGPVSKIKICDQDGLLMCGAFSTALLIDAERVIADPTTNHFTSPIYLGIQFAKANNQKTLEIGKALSLATQAKNFNSCSYDTVGDKFREFTSGQFLTTLYTGFQNGNSSNIQSCFIRSGIADDKLKNLKSISSYLGATDFVDFSSQLFGDICKKDSIPLNTLPQMKTKAAYEFGKNQSAARNAIRNIINENMRRNRPTGINYCGLVLQNPNVNGVNEKGFLNAKECSVNKEIMGHSSTVVGRRLLKYKDGNKMKTICQYLVRDVYGTSCSKYPDDETADPKEKCENGQVWLDEDALFANTVEVFHF